MPQVFDFKTISSKALDEIGRLIERHPDITPMLFSPGEYLLREGDASQEVYVVLAGDYVVEQAPMFPDAPASILAKASCSADNIAIIGEMAYLGGGHKRTASIKAAGDLQVLRLQPEHLDAIIESCPMLTRVLCLQFAQRIRELNEAVRQLEGADFFLETRVEKGGRQAP
jgi:CRP-like cAMP-binding protein